MSLPLKIRKLENLHIVFWLVKDSCWMLELKFAGTLMIGPALFLAVHILIRTRNTPEFYINAAILCWIIANSFWMLIEFNNVEHLRLYTALPFALGLFFVTLFYLRGETAATIQTTEQDSGLSVDSGKNGLNT